MTKFKSKNKKLDTTEKIEKIVKKKKRKLERESSPALSDQSETNKEDIEMNDEYLGSNSRGSSRVASPVNSDCEENGTSNVSSSRRRKAQAKKLENITEISGFVDLTFWKR